MACSVCGGSGHNCRTCPLASGAGSSGGNSYGWSSYGASSSYNYRASPSPSPATYSCGECGLPGHNRRTCPRLQAPPSPPPTRVTYSCGECGAEGHNQRTCPRLQAPSRATPSPLPVRLCGVCGRPGHDRRTCPAFQAPSKATPSPLPVRLCGVCGRPGHDRTTCPALQAPSRATPSHPPARLCGVCGRPGHDRRTCPALQAPSRATSSHPPARLCGVCGRPGHDRRTCPALQAPSRATPSAPPVRLCGECGRPGHDRRTCPKLQAPNRSRATPSPPPTSRVCSECGNSGHNRTTCSRLKNLGNVRASSMTSFTTDKHGSSLLKPSIRTSSKTSERSFSTDARASSFDSASKSKDVGFNRDSIEKLREINRSVPGNAKKGEIDWIDSLLVGKLPAVKATKQASTTVSPSTKEKAKQDTSTQLQREKQTSKKTSKDWLLPEAFDKFSAGPSEADRPGWIYMYTFKDTSHPDRTHKEIPGIRYKIGSTVESLPERRIRAQERYNNEEYVLVKSFETPHRYLTERVIQKQLEESGHSTPREGNINGKTEWYTGSRDKLIDIIKDVNRRVKYEYPVSGPN